MERDDLPRWITFAVMAVALIVGYQFFIGGPEAAKRQAELAKQHPVSAQAQTTAQTQAAAEQAATGAVMSQTQALSTSPRVEIDTPSLSGSIALNGARIDDLSLTKYRQTLDPKSPPVQLLRPQGAASAFYASFPWVSAAGEAVPGLPGANTAWTAQPGAKLTPTAPLVLTYDNGAGLKFTRTISIDANYMFTVADTVANAGATPVSLQAMGVVAQVGTPADFDYSNPAHPHATSSLVHEGGVGVVDGQLKIPSYTCSFGQLFCNAWKKDQPIAQSAVGGWLGITQKYWLAALVPDQKSQIHATYQALATNGPDAFETTYAGPVQTIAPGATATATSHFFAGPKIVSMLRDYGQTYAIPRFDQAVDWGVYWFFTRLIFTGLEFFNSHLANVGLAILALTVVIRLALFPLANKSYESMSKMRKIQPVIEELKKKHPEDQAKLQQETMALYQREKINPLMGCLPLLIQIPLLYSLYKVLTVTIELRQAPFGWIHDLSARDPTSIWTLFGLIPWNPAMAPLIGGYLDGPLHIGLLPLVYGFTMWLSTSMSPPAGDPTQQRMLQFLPLIFTFTLAQFTVGLLIYWTWSNVLTILQQYIIMHRFQVENPIDGFIGRFAKPKPSSG